MERVNNTEDTINHTLTEESKKIISEKSRSRQALPEVKEMLRIQNSGSKNPGSKLSNEDIKYIRNNFIRINQKKTNSRELAKMFNVSSTTIYRVVYKQVYKEDVV